MDRGIIMKNNKSLLLMLPLYIFTVMFVFLPLGYIVFLSFQGRARVWGFTPDFTFDNYRRILEPLYLSCIVQSVKLALSTTLLVALIGYPYGYFMARLDKKWKNRLMLAMLLPFWISSLIRLNGWVIVFRANGVLDLGLMGLGITDKPLKLLFSYPAVLCGMVYALLPFMILSVYSNVEKMDWSLVDAAKDLGAGAFRTFRDITFRLTMPGLISGVVLTFIPSMGLFFIADILGGNKIVLIGSVIHDQLTKGRNLPFAAALSVILMVMTSLMLGIYYGVSKSADYEGD